MSFDEIGLSELHDLLWDRLQGVRSIDFFDGDEDSVQSVIARIQVATGLCESSRHILEGWSFVTRCNGGVELAARGRVASALAFAWAFSGVKGALKALEGLPF